MPATPCCSMYNRVGVDAIYFYALDAASLLTKSIMKACWPALRVRVHCIYSELVLAA